MGTVSSTLVQIEGEYKVAQRCLSGGSVEDKGLDILRFLRGSNLLEFKEKTRNLKSINECEVDRLWIECGADDREIVNLDTSLRFKQKYPQLHMDTGGAEILKLIDDGKIESVFLDTDLPKKSLWCDWCYVIDLDKKTLEIYRGLNKKNLIESDRFYVSEVPYETKYYSVRLLASFDINNLPSDDKFLDITKKESEKLNLCNYNF